VLIWLIFGKGFEVMQSARTPQTPAKRPLALRADESADAGPAALPAATGRALDAARRLWAGLQRALTSPEARPREAVLTFTRPDAFRSFLKRAQTAGLSIAGQVDALLTVRVRFDSPDSLQDDLLRNPDDYLDLGANFLVHIPQVPVAENRGVWAQVPIGINALPFIGVGLDHPLWGRNVTIAVLDSGVMPDATFGDGRLRYLDIGLGTAAGTGREDGHGTAVAALAAGADADAQGAAPAADVLSIRVLGANGTGDAFTLAQGIVAAVEAGARIINISLGTYENSTVLASAINYATARNAVIVAAAGNDRAAQLTWPAADPRVVSVGAVDALEEQVIFSNSSPQLKLTAPGYVVQTAWLDNRRILMSGTSASAPLVAGAIAALISENPALSAPEAARLLQQYASDGGAPGADPDYGAGILNLGWAMGRNDPGRVDTAVSSHHYNAETGQMEIVIQNRSGIGIGGMTLTLDANGTVGNYAVPYLVPGAIHVVRAQVDQDQLKTAGRVDFLSELKNPANVVDRVPANNRRSSTISPPAPEG
jgi:hypothetical protein